MNSGLWSKTKVSLSYVRGLPFSTYAPRGGGASLLYISIAYFMQKGGGWVQKACKIAYVLNGRPLIKSCYCLEVLFVHGYVVLCCLVSLFLGSWLHPQIALAWASLVDTSMGRGYTHEDQNGLCIYRCLLYARGQFLCSLHAIRLQCSSAYLVKKRL